MDAITPLMLYYTGEISQSTCGGRFQGVSLYNCKDEYILF